MIKKGNACKQSLKCSRAILSVSRFINDPVTLVYIFQFNYDDYQRRK